MLRANAENRRKEGNEFYKLDRESVAVKEDLAEDFLALPHGQVVVVQRLVAQLDDDQLDNQVRFEKYEKERRRQEAAKRATTINISDEEQSSKKPPERADVGTKPAKHNSRRAAEGGTFAAT